jgi:hypothetical protein
MPHDQLHPLHPGTFVIGRPVAAARVPLTAA